MNFEEFKALLTVTGSLNGWIFRGYKGWQFEDKDSPSAKDEMVIVAHGVDVRFGNIHLFLEKEGITPIHLELGVTNFSRVRHGWEMDRGMKHVTPMIFTSPDKVKSIRVYRVNLVEPLPD